MSPQRGTLAETSGVPRGHESYAGENRSGYIGDVGVAEHHITCGASNGSGRSVLSTTEFMGEKHFPEFNPPGRQSGDVMLTTAVICNPALLQPEQGFHTKQRVQEDGIPVVPHGLIDDPTCYSFIMISC